MGVEKGLRRSIVFRTFWNPGQLVSHGGRSGSGLPRLDMARPEHPTVIICPRPNASLAKALIRDPKIVPIPAPGGRPALALTPSVRLMDRVQVKDLIASHHPPKLRQATTPSAPSIKPISESQRQLLRSGEGNGLNFVYQPDLLTGLVSGLDAACLDGGEVVPADVLKHWECMTEDHRRYHENASVTNEIYLLHPVYDHQLFHIVHFLVTYNLDRLFKPERRPSEERTYTWRRYRHTNKSVHTGFADGMLTDGVGKVLAIMEIKLPSSSSEDGDDLRDARALKDAASQPSGFQLKESTTEAGGFTKPPALPTVMGQHLLQLVDQMNQSRVGWGVFTCYTTYFLVRRTGYSSFTVSDIILRDRLDGGLHPRYRSSVSTFNPLQLLLGLVFLPNHADRDNDALIAWVPTGNVDARTPLVTKKRPREEGGAGGEGGSGREGEGGEGGAIEGVDGTVRGGRRAYSAALERAVEDPDDSMESIEMVKTPEDAFFPGIIRLMSAGPTMRKEAGDFDLPATTSEALLADKTVPQMIRQLADRFSDTLLLRLSTSPSEPIPSAGRVLEIQRYLSSGRLGSAFLCRITGISYPLVAKVINLGAFPSALHPEADDEDDDSDMTIGRAIRAAEHEVGVFALLATIQGTVIPRLGGVYQLNASDVFLLLMEYVGPSIAAVTSTEAQRESVLTCYKTLHTHGILHGDVQPRHVRIHEDGGARLIDFDLCQTSSSSSEMEEEIRKVERMLTGAMVEEGQS